MVKSPLALSSVPVRPTVGKFGLQPKAIQLCTNLIPLRCAQNLQSDIPVIQSDTHFETQPSDFSESQNSSQCLHSGGTESTSDYTSQKSAETSQPISPVNDAQPLSAMSTANTETTEEEVPDPLPRRSSRIRKPVDRLTYALLGQTKLHRISDDENVKQIYNTKLLAGRKLWEKLKSPQMATTRKKISMRLFLQEHCRNNNSWCSYQRPPIPPL